MIRPATAADFAAVERMLGDFDRAAGLPFEGPASPAYSRDHFAGVVAQLIASARGFAAILDLDGPRGVLLAAAAPSPFRPALWADEIMFWIDPPARGRWAAPMLAEYEAWAAGIGAALVGLSAVEPRAGALFRRRGYRPTETKFCKVI